MVNFYVLILNEKYYGHFKIDLINDFYFTPTNKMCTRCIAYTVSHLRVMSLNHLLHISPLLVHKNPMKVLDLPY